MLKGLWALPTPCFRTAKGRVNTVRNDKLLPGVMECTMFTFFGYGCYCCNWPKIALDIQDIPSMHSWLALICWHFHLMGDNHGTPNLLQSICRWPLLRHPHRDGTICWPSCHVCVCVCTSFAIVVFCLLMVMLYHCYTIFMCRSLQGLF